MDEWLKAAELMDHVADVLAIFIAGTWAYIKFVRGRDFARRAELAIQGSLFIFDDRYLVRVTASLRNAGLTKLPLEQSGKVVYLYGIDLANWSPEANVNWRKLMITPAFQDHAWVEPQEVITDELLIPVPTENHATSWLAYKIRIRVMGKRGRLRGGGTVWDTSLVVPAQIRPANAGAGMDWHREQVAIQLMDHQTGNGKS
jgi:hypothetical protein